MSKITAYASLTAPVGGDQTVAVDVSDTTMAATGTTKKLAMSDLAAFVTSYMGMQFFPATSTPTTPSVISTSTIASAMAAGYQGIFLDPRQVWDMTGVVLNSANFPSGISNFTIESRMTGSVGWGGNISHGAGYIKTDTATAPADGIQVYSDGTFETQGLIFRNCAFIGANSNAVIHLGGRQRRVMFPGCFIYNTNATTTTVAAGSNGVAVSTFTGTGTLNVASSTAFATSGNVVVSTGTSIVATISYTGKGTGTLTGCTLLGGTGSLATGGTVAQAAFGLSVDTQLSNNNSENSDFGPQLTVAGANCAIGLSVNDQTQHANDSLWSGLTTAAGQVSIVAMTASNMTFINYYDRSSPALCTVANHNGILTFQQGESLNGSTSGPHDLVNTGAHTIYISRTLTQVTATNTAVIIGGRMTGRGRARWAGTIPISSSGGLDISDPSGSFTNLTITGGAGNTLLLSGQWLAGAVGPTVGGYTGTTHTSSWA